MADAEVLQARLEEAETALHALMTGSKEVQVRHRDKDVRFTQATLGELRAYIAELKSELGLGGRARARRVVFG